jgi:hypothetical protein
MKLLLLILLANVSIASAQLGAPQTVIAYDPLTTNKRSIETFLGLKSEAQVSTKAKELNWNVQKLPSGTILVYEPFLLKPPYTPEDIKNLRSLMQRSKVISVGELPTTFQNLLISERFGGNPKGLKPPTLAEIQRSKVLIRSDFKISLDVGGRDVTFGTGQSHTKEELQFDQNPSDWTPSTSPSQPLYPAPRDFRSAAFYLIPMDRTIGGTYKTVAEATDWLHQTADKLQKDLDAETNRLLNDLFQNHELGKAMSELKQFSDFAALPKEYQELILRSVTDQPKSYGFSTTDEAMKAIQKSRVSRATRSIQAGTLGKGSPNVTFYTLARSTWKP